MLGRLLFCLILSLGTLSNTSADQIEDLPLGCELATLPDPEEWESKPFEELNPKGGSWDEMDESTSRILATIEGLPSSIVAGCVNAITGDFFDSHIDLVCPGALPIVVQRTWCSADKKWHFSHFPELEVWRSGGKNNLLAGYSDDTGMGLFFHTSHDEESGSFTIPERIFKKGFTNCGAGEISAQTNWKNARLVFVRRDEEKMYLIRHPSRIDRLFRYQRKGEHHRPGAPTGVFQLLEEIQPNGNQLKYSYNTSDVLSKVEAVNSNGEPLQEITIKGSQKVSWDALSTQVLYKYDSYKRKKLLSVSPSHAVAVSYDYDSHHRIIRKDLPEGRTLAISYHHHGSDKGMVSDIKAPVGEDGTLFTIYKFFYYNNYGKDLTEVFDAAGNRTDYISANQRLEKIIRYKDCKIVLNEETFNWDSNGGLTSHTFSGDDRVHFTRTLEYDNSGNVIKEILKGNLTGLQPNEEYVKTYDSSPSKEWNLPVEERDGRKWVRTTFYPKTNLLCSRITGTDATPFKREFFKYDHNGVLIEEILDDGIGDNVNDWSYVNERHIKRITPTQTTPIGLPQEIREYYLNLWTSQEFLVKKVIKSYSPQGKVIEEKHYDSKEALAYTLTWEYDLLGNVIKQTNALGETVTFQYDANGNKIVEHRPDCTKTFVYDFSNRLIQETEQWPNGTKLTVSHRYNHLSQKVATIDIYGHETLYSYDCLGRLIETRKGEHIKKTEYDAVGNPIATWNSNNNCTKKKFTVRGQPYHIEYPDCSIETKEYTIDGLLKKEVATNGTITCYTHDPLGRVVKKEIFDSAGTLLKQTQSIYGTFHLHHEIDEEGQKTSYTYDFSGRLFQEKKGEKIKHYLYDNLGRKIKTIEAGQVKAVAYDLLDRIIEERIETLSGDVFKKEQFRYDYAGNQTHHITFTQAGKAVTETEYNPHGKPTCITDPFGHKTYFTYDYAASHEGQPVLKVTEINPHGQQKLTLYNVHGKEIVEMKQNSLGKIVQRQTHLYDHILNRIETTEENFIPNTTSQFVTTAWEYDGMGHIIKCTEAKGTEQKVTTTFYNSYGQKERMLMPNGVSIAYEYDALGRLKTETSSDNTIHYTYTYDIKDRILSAKDRLSNTETARSYDNYGRLICETLSHGAQLRYKYDLHDRPKEVLLPDQSAIVYRYSPCSLIAINRIREGLPVYQHTYDEFDGSGKPVSETCLDSVCSISYERDLVGRITRIIAPNWEERSRFDAIGNLIEKTLTDIQGSVTTSYTYDDLDQLTTETNSKTQTYLHDSLYNRVNKSGKDYKLNSLNQLTSENDNQYQYDPNGNLIRRNDMILTYDALNRLIAVDHQGCRTNYTYDAFHRRVSKTCQNCTENYLYQGQNEIGAIIDGCIKELRLLAKGKAVAFEFDGIPYVPIQDAASSLTLLLDTNANSIASYRYTAFGEMEIVKRKIENRWGFSGKRLDPETGFIYFGRRYYAPDIGRWITPDPAGFADGMNLYAYVHNSPLLYVDPDGQLASLIPLAISIVSSMVIDYALPTAETLTAEYGGGTAVSAAVTGFANGYTGGYSAFFAADAAVSLSEKASSYLGAIESIAPPNLSRKTVANVAQSQFTGLVVNKAANKASPFFSWMNKQTARKCTQEAVSNTVEKTTKIAKQSGPVKEKAIKEYVNLASEKRTKHLLQADDLSGGHLYPTGLGKTSFPKLLNENKIMHYVSDIATDPNIKWIQETGPKGSLITKKGSPVRFSAQGGTREGITIRTTIEPMGDGIITAYPIY